MPENRPVIMMTMLRGSRRLHDHEEEEAEEEQEQQRTTAVQRVSPHVGMTKKTMPGTRKTEAGMP